MKVQLKILGKARGNYRVEAYKVLDDKRIFIGLYDGLIFEIQRKIEFKECDKVEIEKSLFQGWY
jgi:hypothetical protein